VAEQSLNSILVKKNMLRITPRTIGQLRLAELLPVVAIVVMALFLVLSVDSATICTAGQAKPSVAAASPANSYAGELETLINNAKDIYEHAKSNKWKHIGTKLNAIKKAEQQTFAGVTNDNISYLLPKLIEATSDLEQAVTLQQRLNSMIFANRITIIGSKMIAPLNPRIPTNVAIIGCSARKLEILAETQNVAKMTDIVYRIHLSWQPLIPQVIEHGGTKEIKRFAEIMRRLEAAKTPEEYGRQADFVLEEVNNLEQLFSK
jgi:hypothetical protein